MFLNLIHPFQDKNGRTCKILFADQINNMNKFSALDTKISEGKIEVIFCQIYIQTTKYFE